MKAPRRCKCPKQLGEDGVTSTTLHTVACEHFEGPVRCGGCGRVKHKVNHWFLVAVTKVAQFVCAPQTKGNAGRLARHHPGIPITPVCGFGCAQKLFELYMHGERGKTFSHAIARSDIAKSGNYIDRMGDKRYNYATNCAIQAAAADEMMLGARPGFKADPKLEELLEATKNYCMTPEEREAQRQSWVRGEMAIGTDSDEARARGCELIVNKEQGND